MFDLIGAALVIGAIVIVAGLVIYTAREAWQAGYEEGWREANRHYNVIPLQMRSVEGRPAARHPSPDGTFTDRTYPYRGEVD